MSAGRAGTPPRMKAHKYVRRKRRARMNSQNRPTLLILGTALPADHPCRPLLEQYFTLESAADVASTTETIDATSGEEDAVLLTPGLILAEVGGFKTLERALAKSEALKILGCLGEGVCLTDTNGHIVWNNQRFNEMADEVRTRVGRICVDSVRFFSEQADLGDDPSRKVAFRIGNNQYFEMIISPVIESGSPETPESMRVVAITLDNSHHKRMVQKLDAIDRAGEELVRIESDVVSTLNTAERLALLEDKIINYTRDLLHFDHFNIFLREKNTNRLMPVMNVGMPSEVGDYELYAQGTGSGISGHVASTGKSYICHDVQNDPRYLPGLENAASSLSIPLELRDEVIGVFNIESERPGAFSEDDRQIAEIFARYIAIALSILDLLVVERHTTSGTVAVNVIGEISQPLNDIAAEADALKEVIINDEEASAHLTHIIDLVETIRKKVEDVARGPRTILGVHEAMENAEIDPLLHNRHVLIADDEPNIRETIEAVLSKRGACVTVCDCGQVAIDFIEAAKPASIDLVLSDISMPDRNGYEVFAAARRFDDNVPVILMTGFGYDPHHSIVRASQEGLQCVLFKPFQVEQLMEELQKAMMKD